MAGPSSPGGPHGGSVTDITATIDVRARRARRLRRVLVGVLVGVVVLLGVGLWVVRHSSLLDVRRVEVSGTSILSADAVRKAADVTVGRPLARVDVSAVSSRVAALPPVREVTVSRHWPHTLRIEVTERQVVYQLRGSGQYRWIDRQGVTVATSPTPRKGTVWAVTATTDPRLLRDVATVVASLPPGLRRQVDHVEATGPDSISLRLTKGRTVVWGSADRSDLKAKVAAAIIGAKGSVYDVSSPEHPTAR